MRWFLIDKYFDIIPGKSLKAIKLISHNEFFYNQHMIHKPIFPETLLIEMMAQAGGVLSGVSMGFQKEVVLGKIETANFLRQISPPAKITIEARLEMVSENFSWTQMTMSDEAGEFADGKIFFAFLDAFRNQDSKESLVFKDGFLNSYNLMQHKKEKEVSHV